MVKKVSGFSKIFSGGLKLGFCYLSCWSTFIKKLLDYEKVKIVQWEQKGLLEKTKTYVKKF